MNIFMNNMRDKLAKRAAYRTTVAELRALPMESRIDLNIAGIEKQVAHRAVYG